MNNHRTNMLNKKADENIGIVKYFLKTKERRSLFSNAIASRLYYAIFQKIKHSFQNCGIDYTKYRNDRDRHDFSHGTLNKALISELKNIQNKDCLDFETTRYINRIGSIYTLRRNADYENNKIIDPDDIEDHYKNSVKIIDIIDKNFGVIYE